MIIIMWIYRKIKRILIVFSLFLFTSSVYADGRLLATGGATQVEGSAGGGIVPWAVISGYGTEDENGVTGFGTRVATQDFTLNTVGVAAGFHNRLELSYAQQSFKLDSLGGSHLKQYILGAKVRVAGDLVYSKIPQISAGIQYKENNRYALPKTVGSKNNNGLDLYVSATKLWLGGFFNYNLLTNLTLRSTKANQMGLLGFGGDKNDDYELQVEGSIAVLLNRRFAIGYEFRQKPDNLGFAEESDWHDVFVGWFPNKNVAVVAAYADLGTIAGFDNQDAFYTSIQVSF